MFIIHIIIIIIVAGDVIIYSDGRDVIFGEIPSTCDNTIEELFGGVLEGDGGGGGGARVLAFVGFN